MTQLSLEYSADARAADGWREMLRAIRECVEAIGFKEAVARLDVQPSVLSEALADRGNRHAQARWLPVLLVVAPEPSRKALLDVMAALAGYELQPRRVLTTAERLERLESALRSKLGKVGEELLAEVGK